MGQPDISALRAELIEMQIAHVRAVNRTITSQHISFLAQLQAIRAEQLGEVPLDDETDLARLGTESATYQTLASLNVTLLELTQYLHGERTSLVRVEEGQQQILKYWHTQRIVNIVLILGILLLQVGLLVGLSWEIDLLRAIPNAFR